MTDPRREASDLHPCGLTPEGGFCDGLCVAGPGEHADDHAACDPIDCDEALARADEAAAYYAATTDVGPTFTRPSHWTDRAWEAYLEAEPTTVLHEPTCEGECGRDATTTRTEGGDLPTFGFCDDCARRWDELTSTPSPLPDPRAQQQAERAEERRQASAEGRLIRAIFDGPVPGLPHFAVGIRAPYRPAGRVIA